MPRTTKEWQFELAVKLFIILSVFTILIAAQTFFIPFVFAVFLSFLLYPISNRLERFKVPKGLAIVISIFFAIIIFAGLIWFFVGQVVSFQDDLPELKAQVSEKANRLINWISQVTKIEPERIQGWMKTKIKESDSAGAELVVGVFSFTGTFLATLGLIPIYIYFLTYYKEKYKTFIKLTVKEKHEKTIEVVEKISTVSKNYLKGVFIDIVILSILGSVGYMILGLEHAVLFGVLAAILNIVPYIGVMVGSLLPVMMALITKDEIGYAFGAMGVAVVVQFLDNNFISPYIVGSSVSINPLTAIVVLIIGALTWGIAGMVLSIPLAGVMKLICDNFESLKPYGYLIGEERTFGKKKFLSRK